MSRVKQFIQSRWLRPLAFLFTFGFSVMCFINLLSWAAMGHIVEALCLITNLMLSLIILSPQTKGVKRACIALILSFGTLVAEIFETVVFLIKGEPEYMKSDGDDSVVDVPFGDAPPVLHADGLLLMPSMPSMPPMPSMNATSEDTATSEPPSTNTDQSEVESLNTKNNRRRATTPPPTHATTRSRAKQMRRRRLSSSSSS